MYRASRSDSAELGTMRINDNNSIRTASTEAIMTQGPAVLIQESLLCKWKTGRRPTFGFPPPLQLSLSRVLCNCVLPSLFEFYFVLKGVLCTDSFMLKMHSTSVLHFLSP